MKTLGRQGEKYAEDYLVKIGYGIVDHNYTSPYGEIDIIALSGDQLVCVEVKTRSTARSGYPEMSISSLKLRKIMLTAELFIARNPPYANLDIRIDVLALIAHQKGTDIRHFKNVSLYDTI